jgi:hypothetical protein
LRTVTALCLGESEDAEWMDEDEKDCAGLNIPLPAVSSGLPLVESNELLLPWD